LVVRKRSQQLRRPLSWPILFECGSRPAGEFLLQNPGRASLPAPPASPGYPSVGTRWPREHRGQPLGFVLRTRRWRSKWTKSFPGLCPPGALRSSHSAPGRMVVPGEFVLLAQRQIGREPIWTRGARPQGSRQDRRESKETKRQICGSRFGRTECARRASAKEGASQWAPECRPDSRGRHNGI
jgi:hypothetical protein